MTFVTSTLEQALCWLPRQLTGSWAASDWNPAVIPFVIYGWVTAIIVE